MSLTSDQSEVGTRREDPLGSYLALAAEEQYDRIIISIVLTKGGMEIVKAQVLHLKRLWKNKRRLKVQAANLAMVVCFSLMIWKGLVVITGCKAPVVVVLRYAFLCVVLLCIITSLVLNRYLSHLLMMSVGQWNHLLKEENFYS